MPSAFPRAGFDTSGLTTDGRWQSDTGGTIQVDCSSGSISNGDKFTLTGNSSDISSIKVKLNYTSGATPPAKLKCSTDGSNPTADC